MREEAQDEAVCGGKAGAPRSREAAGRDKGSRVAGAGSGGLLWQLGTERVKICRLSAWPR